MVEIRELVYACWTNLAVHFEECRRWGAWMYVQEGHLKVEVYGKIKF